MSRIKQSLADAATALKGTFKQNDQLKKLTQQDSKGQTLFED